MCFYVHTQYLHIHRHTYRHIYLPTSISLMTRIKMCVHHFQKRGSNFPKAKAHVWIARGVWIENMPMKINVASRPSSLCLFLLAPSLSPSLCLCRSPSLKKETSGDQNQNAVSGWDHRSSLHPRFRGYLYLNPASIRSVTQLFFSNVFKNSYGNKTDFQTVAVSVK